MVYVKKTYKEDFEKIYELLLDFNNPRIKKEDWRQLFIDYWKKDENYVGYVLVDKGKIVGFIGTIFSKRFINDNQFVFCNLTSWIVKKAYRNKSLHLLFPILRLKDCTLTNFSPGNYDIIFKMFGFKKINTDIVVILPLPNIYLALSKKNCHLILDKALMGKYMNDSESKIFHDHFKFNCVHLMIISNSGNCYMIAKKVIRRRLPFIHVVFISNKIVFSMQINRSKFEIMTKLKVVGIIIDERFLSGCVIPYAIKYKRQNTILYKSNILKEEDIDILYSEMFLLGHETL